MQRLAYTSRNKYILKLSYFRSLFLLLICHDQRSNLRLSIIVGGIFDRVAEVAMQALAQSSALLKVLVMGMIQILASQENFSSLSKPA